MVKRRAAASRQATTSLIARRPTGDRILSSAAQVFAKRGYGETSLRELMSAAGVSTTAFYVRFASKEEVLDALVRQLLGELGAAATATLAAGGGLDAGFRRGITAMTEVLLRHRTTVRLTLTEASCSAASRATLARAYGELAALLGARLAHVSRMKPSEGLAAGWALVGALAMQVQRWAVFEELDDAALEKALTATARVLMPAAKKRVS